MHSVGELDAGQSCIVLVGPPGAGKSTVSLALARRLSRSALFSSDEISRLIVSGYVWPLGTPADEASAQVDLTLSNLLSLASNFMAAGFTPIVETIFDTARRFEQFRRELGARLVLVVLDVDEHTCRRRDAGRPVEERFSFDDYSGLRARMHAAFGAHGWWFDTSELTVEETVELIVAGAADRAKAI